MYDVMMRIAAFFIVPGTAIVCLVLIVTGIWRWLAHPEKRQKRLDAASWISMAVLAVMVLIYRNVPVASLLNSTNASDSVTALVVNVSKIAIKLLMLGAVVSCVLLLLCVVFLFVRYAVSIIWRARPGGNSKNLAKELKDKGQEFSKIMKSPLLILAITCGIMGVFIMTPLLMGNPEEEGLSEIWEDGIKNIAAFAQNGNKDDLPTALFTYILIFIIILGLSCAVIQILYSIISDIFVKKHGNGLIDEYSGSIGILAVGVSILWTLQRGKVNFSDPDSNIVWEFLKSFGSVLFIIAVGVLVLEVIRLLMDMKEKLIRIEARYLFICLVGEAALLLLDIIILLYHAVSSTTGSKENEVLENVLDKTKDLIVAAMDRQLNTPGNYKRVFSGFKGRVTNKRGGGPDV